MGFYYRTIGCCLVMLLIGGGFLIILSYDGESSPLCIRDNIIIIWDIQDMEVQQSENVHIEIIVINPNEFNITIFLGWSFDWYNESMELSGCRMRNDTIYYYSYPIDPYNNRTIKSHSYGIFHFDITVDAEVPVGYHEYHLTCTFGRETPPTHFGGATPPEILWSQIISDFKVLEIDSDGDGVPDSQDRFPNDPNESSDIDLDGVGDNTDSFPDFKLEWTDSDNDGIGDNTDRFPNDSNEWSDIDLDGIGDNSDAFPLDPSASIDTDGDGYPDRWNDGKDIMDSTPGLKLDAYPNDLNKWKKDDNETNNPTVLIVIVLILLLIIGLWTWCFYIFKRE